MKASGHYLCLFCEVPAGGFMDSITLLTSDHKKGN